MKQKIQTYFHVIDEPTFWSMEDNLKGMLAEGWTVKDMKQTVFIQTAGKDREKSANVLALTVLFEK